MYECGRLKTKTPIEQCSVEIFLEIYKCKNI